MTGIKKKKSDKCSISQPFSLWRLHSGKKAGNSSQDQAVQEDNETEQVKTEKSRERRNQ